MCLLLNKLTTATALKKPNIKNYTIPQTEKLITVKYTHLVKDAEVENIRKHYSRRLVYNKEKYGEQICTLPFDFPKYKLKLPNNTARPFLLIPLFNMAKSEEMKISSKFFNRELSNLNVLISKPSLLSEKELRWPCPLSACAIKSIIMEGTNINAEFNSDYNNLASGCFVFKEPVSNRPMLYLAIFLPNNLFIYCCQKSSKKDKILDKLNEIETNPIGFEVLIKLNCFKKDLFFDTHPSSKKPCMLYRITFDKSENICWDSTLTLNFEGRYKKNGLFFDIKKNYSHSYLNGMTFSLLGTDNVTRQSLKASCFEKKMRSLKTQ
ncbi:hypothetical protein CDIK_0986 [Cucumispora dikerogammari]|nr:hypothetical protein CDIK_0986 [Cucumispora dikerogammari]